MSTRLRFSQSKPVMNRRKISCLFSRSSGATVTCMILNKEYLSWRTISPCWRKPLQKRYFQLHLATSIKSRKQRQKFNHSYQSSYLLAHNQPYPLNPRRYHLPTRSTLAEMILTPRRINSCSSERKKSRSNRKQKDLQLWMRSAII